MFLRRTFSAYLNIEAIIWTILIGPNVRCLLPGHSSLHTHLVRKYILKKCCCIISIPCNHNIQTKILWHSDIQCGAPHVQMWYSLVSRISCSPPFSPSHPQSPDLQQGDAYYHRMLRFTMNDTKKNCLTKNSHVISAIPLGFLYDCCQCVREILEQSVLLMDLHAQNTVQELSDVVVVCSRV